MLLVRMQLAGWRPILNSHTIANMPATAIQKRGQIDKLLHVSSHVLCGARQTSLSLLQLRI